MPGASMHIVATLSSLLVCWPLFLAAQTNPAASKDDGPALKFEVVSIKRNTTTLNGNRSINRAPGGDLNATNATLRLLLRIAYDVRDYQIANAPGWAGSDGFDIVGKVDRSEGKPEGADWSPANVARLASRMRTMLMERFGLAAHKETREGPVFNLVIAKGGPKLAASTGDGPPESSFNLTRLKCKNITIQDFATMLLQSRMERTVLDKTGLTGKYDFQMDFAPDVTASNGADVNTSGLPAAPSFVTALQEQLGLRLESARGPVETLVIDQVQPPTGN